jgi:hypothetical protein
LWKKDFRLAQKRAGQHKENKGSTDESPAKLRGTIIHTSQAGGWAEGIILLKKMTNCKSTTSPDASAKYQSVICRRASVGDRNQRSMKIFINAKLTSTAQTMDYWADRTGVKLDFIRPGKSVENGYTESFNDRMR